MVLGRYRQTAYGMYGTNPENAGTVTILACLLGRFKNEFLGMVQPNFNVQIDASALLTLGTQHTI